MIAYNSKQKRVYWLFCLPAIYFLMGYKIQLRRNNFFSEEMLNRYNIICVQTDSKTTFRGSEKVEAFWLCWMQVPRSWQQGTAGLASIWTSRNFPIPDTAGSNRSTPGHSWAQEPPWEHLWEKVFKNQQKMLKGVWEVCWNNTLLFPLGCTMTSEILIRLWPWWTAPGLSCSWAFQRYSVFPGGCVVQQASFKLLVSSRTRFGKGVHSELCDSKEILFYSLLSLPFPTFTLSPSPASALMPLHWF